MANYNVKISCKTTSKNLCKSCALFCAKLININFPHYFSQLSHSLFHNHSTDKSYQYFPLFHRPYNYNSYLIINSNNRKELK